MVILSAPGISLIQSTAPSSLFKSIISAQMLINFLIILFVIWLYDRITAKRSFSYQELLGGILVSLILAIGSSSGQLFTVTVFIFVLVFLYAGFIIGKRLKDLVDSARETKMVDGAIIFLLIIWIGYVAATNLSGYIAKIPAVISTTSTSMSTTIRPLTTSPFYTVLGYKGNYLVFLTCQGTLCSLDKLNQTLQAQAAYIPYAGNSTIQPILSQQQTMQSIFGFGLTGASPLNTSELATGSLRKLFHTPIQLLSFNLTLKGIQAYGGFTADYYNPGSNGTTVVSLNETILATTQASYIFITQAHATPNIGVIGTTGTLQYFINSTLVQT